MVTSLLLLLVGATLTLLTLVLLETRLPKQRNFVGESIPTSAGLLFIPIILITFILAVGGALTVGEGGLLYLVYGLVAVIVGFADDFWGGTGVKGLRGHLGALGRGHVTTGLLKVFVLGGGAVVFGALVFGPTVAALVAAFLIAGSANLANLLDLRPGRALKFLAVPLLILLFLAPHAAVLSVMGIVGGVVGLFYFDLKGRIMLGDAGAAVYGSVLGYLVVMSGPGLVWWVAGVAILGLTILAEVSSISRVIREVEVLRRFDSWGRDGDE